MDIGPVILTVHQDTWGWDFKVDYTLNFSQTEVNANYEFEHGVVLWERDRGEIFGGDDDQLLTLANRVLNPSTTTEPITRQFADQWGAVLNTEAGGEEIWVEVYARNITTAGQVMSRKSEEIHIAP